MTIEELARADHRRLIREADDDLERDLARVRAARASLAERDRKYADRLDPRG